MLLLISRDVSVQNDSVVGKGATAITLKGVISPESQTKHGFSDVAVKVFKDGTESDAVKFELALLSSLQRKSAHILYLVGYLPQPLTIVTRFYENGTLYSRIHNLEIPYEADFMWRIAFGVARGMAEVHKASVVHFDLKPVNILLDERLQPVIADFGAAKVVGVPKAVSTLTAPQEFFLTPWYAAPEAFTQGSRAVTDADKKVDVYSYAISMWELLSRRHVWPQEKLELMAIQDRVMQGQRPAIDDAMREKNPVLVKVIKTRVAG